MNRTRISLCYLASYLLIIGFGLLLAPSGTLAVLQSNSEYGDVFPRVAGMLMAGLGMAIFSIIRAGAKELYSGTLIVRTFFIGCLAAFYLMTRDPLFLVILGIVAFGFVLTLLSYVADHRQVA
jgi:hypothetical protein